MARFRTSGALMGILGGLVLVGQAQESAFQAPTVTVVGYHVGATTGFSVKDVDALTEALAVRLVESGRYRVLDRAWLGAALDPRRPLPISAMRAKAKEAGVDYLLAGRVDRVVARRAGCRQRPDHPNSTAAHNQHFHVRHESHRMGAAASLR